jgi:hypothetical protein
LFCKAKQNKTKQNKTKQNITLLHFGEAKAKKEQRAAKKWLHQEAKQSKEASIAFRFSFARFGRANAKASAKRRSGSAKPKSKEAE